MKTMFRLIRARELARMLGLAAAGLAAYANAASANEVLCDTGALPIAGNYVQCGDYAEFYSFHEGAGDGATTIVMNDYADSLNGVAYYCDAYGGASETGVVSLSFERALHKDFLTQELIATTADGSTFYSHLDAVRLMCATFDPAPVGPPPPEAPPSPPAPPQPDVT
jgi:hypothetical protein